MLKHQTVADRFKDHPEYVQHIINENKKLYLPILSLLETSLNNMFLDQFYATIDGKVHIKGEQASHFAKDISGDFNPLHDPESKRFCVPGDLLFSIVLEKYGLSQKMQFHFSGMVGHGVYLNFPDTDASQFEISDDNGKTYLRVERSGDCIRTELVIENFIRKYVAFSGLNFPHVLVPLMAKHNVMINTERPLVIYDSMSFEIDQLNFQAADLEASATELEAKGKRGEARLHFNINADNTIVGKGYKKLLISGMREYHEETIQQFVDNYLAHMDAYQA